MKHELPKLPYSENALEPILSKETLEYHYGRHHKAYVTKLNELIPNTEFENLSLEEIIARAPEGAVFNNAAQIWNHTFYWHSLTPNKGGTKPQGDLLKAIEKSFGNLDGFREKFEKAAVGQFGSGWAWLVKNKDGSLAIETTPNAVNPIKTGKAALLTADVWEHAYYIDYRNERPRYLSSIWPILNWDFAEKNFKK